MTDHPRAGLTLIERCETHQGAQVSACLQCEVEALRRERDELRTDALRYRWLRDTSCPEHGDIYLASDSAWQSFRAGAVDAAIDAALLREEGR